MSKSIKISDEAMNLLREEASLYSRSIAGQAEHWLRIGRAIEKSPSFNYRHIKDALAGFTSPDELNVEEQEVFFEEFSDAMWEVTPEQEKAFEKQLGSGRFSGLDKNNKLIYQEITDKD